MSSSTHNQRSMLDDSSDSYADSETFHENDSYLAAVQSDLYAADTKIYRDPSELNTISQNASFTLRAWEELPEENTDQLSPYVPRPSLTIRPGSNQFSSPPPALSSGAGPATTALTLASPYQSSQTRRLFPGDPNPSTGSRGSFSGSTHVFTSSRRRSLSSSIQPSSSPAYTHLSQPSSTTVSASPSSTVGLTPVPPPLFRNESVTAATEAYEAMAFLRQVGTRLVSYHSEVTNMLEKEEMLSSATAYDLRVILEQLDRATKNIELDFESMGVVQQSSVLALLGLNNVHWNFDNETVRHFRNTMLLFEPQEADIRDGIAKNYYPLYLSSLPHFLAPMIQLHVRFPAHLDLPTFCELVPADRLASVFLVELQSRVRGSIEGPFILKGLSVAEYVYGNYTLSSFTVIREALRKDKIAYLEFIPKQPVESRFISTLLDLYQECRKDFYDRCGRELPVELEFVTEDMDEVLPINMSFFENPQVGLAKTLSNVSYNPALSKTSSISLVSAPSGNHTRDQRSFTLTLDDTDSDGDFGPSSAPSHVTSPAQHGGRNLALQVPEAGRWDHRLTATDNSDLENTNSVKLMSLPLPSTRSLRTGYETLTKYKTPMHANKRTPSVASIVLASPSVESTQTHGDKHGRSGRVFFQPTSSLGLPVTDGTLINNNSCVSALGEDDLKAVPIFSHSNESSMSHYYTSAVQNTASEREHSEPTTTTTTSGAVPPPLPFDQPRVSLSRPPPPLPVGIQVGHVTQPHVVTSPFVSPWADVDTTPSPMHKHTGSATKHRITPNEGKHNDFEEEDEEDEVFVQTLSMKNLPNTNSHSHNSVHQHTNSTTTPSETPLSQTPLTSAASASQSNMPRSSLFRFSSIYSMDSDSSRSTTPSTNTSSHNSLQMQRGSMRVLNLLTAVTRKHIDDDPGGSLLMPPLPATINANDVHVPLRIRVNGLDEVTDHALPRLDSSIVRLYLACCLVNGFDVLPQSVCSTEMVDRTSSPRWNTYLQFPGPLYYASLPTATKIVFVLVGQRQQSSNSKEDVPLGWVSCQLYDHAKEVMSGTLNMGMWPLPVEDAEESDFIKLGLGASGNLANLTNVTKKEKEEKKDKKKDKTVVVNNYVTKNIDLSKCIFAFKGTNRPNLSRDTATRVCVTFDTFVCPVTMPDTIVRDLFAVSIGDEITMDKKQRLTLELLERQDALYELTSDEESLLWKIRSSLVNKPHLLPIFIRVVDWLNVEHILEAHRLLKEWIPPTSIPLILPLLDAKYQDSKVRGYAVQCLQRMHPAEVKLYLPQLTQCLKYETHHDSALSRFLIQIAIDHPFQVGHYLFWSLKNEMQCDPPFCERFACILDVFLSFCPVACEQLRIQQRVVDKLRRLTQTIQAKRHHCSDKELQQFLENQIHALNRDFLSRLPGGKFQMPLDPRYEASTLIAEKCKIMSSKMAPLWLVFNNADPNAPPIFIIFKAGDDLRQDILTLQILQYMDQIWLKNGLDLRLSPYNVIATGMTESNKGCGMIEVVLRSCTTAGIQMQYGGGASGAFKLETLDQYLRAHNPTKEQYDRAVSNFTHSCAGYCVATYVMGIGDRHNGNIMITQDGHLFHIDFGHFLGNFKFKYGIKRERSAFVFTQEMAYVMGGESSKQFKEFKELCYKAFVCLRKHATELETLFLSMSSAGMPELISAEDVSYLRSQLWLHLEDGPAKDQFKAELKRALAATSRRLDNYFHLLKHANKAKD